MAQNDNHQGRHDFAVGVLEIMKNDKQIKLISIQWRSSHHTPY